MKKILCSAALFLFFASNVFAIYVSPTEIIESIFWGNPEFIFDGQARIRYEFLNNNSSLGLTNDERDYFRFKFSGGFLASFLLYSVYGKLTTESRSYIYNAGGDAQYDINEAVIDNLFINIPKICGVVDIKVGRMDLDPKEYGEGFLIADGTPLDGSRTYYFNAARVRYSTLNSSIELLGIYNTEYDDLPVINDQDRRLNDSQESAFIAYGRSRLTEQIYIEPYYMWKKEEASSGNGQLLSQQETSINTFGSYFKYDFNKYILRAQAALQFGNYDDEISCGFGGYAFLDVPLMEIFKPLNLGYFSLGYIYLSGDDRNTDKVEAWNPLFSRYPWMSEIMTMLYARESGVGYWTNLQMCRLEAKFNPLDALSVNASYDFVYANENVAGQMFGDGKNRGNLMRLKVGYKHSDRFSSYILGEYFIPGDFYNKDTKDASFLRVEFMAKI